MIGSYVLRARHEVLLLDMFIEQSNIYATLVVVLLLGAMTSFEFLYDVSK